MSNLLRKTVSQIWPAIRISPTHHFYFTHIQSFSSSSLSPIDQTPNQHPFIVNYLVNSCGFTLEKAITASKHKNFETPEKPDSVIAFLCNHGFTKTQALNLIRKVPQVILSNPQKTLLPKLEFLKSKGFSSTDVVKILTRTPYLFRRSLKNQIIPVFDFIKDLIGSEERTISAIKHFAGLFLVVLKTRMAPNVQVLQEAGVPVVNIGYLLKHQPRSLNTSCERFRQIVQEVKGIGIDPMRVTFVLAVTVLNSMSKPFWENKIKLYKKWGLSQDEILVNFGKYPWFMSVSEDKITRIMEFLVKKMDLDSSFVLRRPELLSLSFEKRIVPRCLVYQALQEKGLINKSNMSYSMLRSNETWFVQKVVNLAKDEAPEVLKFYEEKLALAG